MKYFEVFFPNGNRGVFGDMSNSQNLLAYPIFLLNDLHGNTINYDYSYNGNHYSISKISYNGNSVEFQYTYSRTDPISSYTGGMIVAETRLLKEIISKHGANILGTYTLSYTVEKDKSLLTRVDFSADGNFYNPISFRYGEGNVADVYTISTTQLSEWYEFERPNMLKVVRGRFDYFNHADGLIVLPNKNPYWKHYRHPFPWRSQKRFINQYRGDEKIFLYTGLKDNFTSPMPNLYTEEGFVDIICGDLEGNQEEYIVKINDKVVNNNDQITFNVYRSNLYTGLTKICIRNYSFPTVYKDANEGKSIQPKFYYTGDFNGDGKMEVLAVSVNHPFDDTGKPSMCYVFDLMNDKIMYQGHVFPFNIDFVGTRQENPDAANNNSDKLLVMDYDGDGKSDICHINEEGIHIYTFETAGTTICGAKKVNSATTLRKSTLADRRIVMGEFNGDGLTDLLVSPLSKNSNDRTWVIYFSRGDGRFDSSTFYKDNKEGLEFMGQDVNGDGTTDLISYDVEGFITHLTTNRRDREGRILISNTCYNNFPSKKSITTSFEYDKYRRRVKLVDPSMGTTTYEYNAEGNISKETDANGKVRQYVYDQYGRLSKSSCPEFVTLYKYNSVNDLTEVSTSNGTGESFAYDVFGRVTCQKEIAPDGKWLQRDYSYIDGKVGSIRYRSPSGEFAKEDYVYENGSLKAVKLNGKENIYNMTSLNSLGVVPEVSTGAINRNYDYTSIGLLTGRRGSSNNKKYQDFSYVFDANTSNLISRKDNTRNLSENFEYDNLNRLTTFGGKQTSYDNRGNIIGQSDIGTFDYAIAQKPYAVSEIDLSSNRISTRSQDITYTSFSRPKTISENGYTAEFIYTGDYDRIKMTILQKGNKISTRYYMGDCYELEETPETKKERLCLGGDYYSAPAVLVREKGLSKLYYILRDHLGSITHIIDADGKLVQELSYDAWGRLRNPDNHQIYEPEMEPNLFLGRGYTGHEHLVQFGLINMNARLYDAALGRFLSPDPYVQMPDFTQNFNRYSYSLNNPLKYIDKDGEFVHLIVGIAIVAGAYFGGSAANGTFNPIKWNYSSWKTYAGMVVGGVAGYAGATLGASVAASAVASGYSSIAAGVAGGMVGGMVSGAINGAGMTPINGGSFSDMIEAVSFGTVMGGFGGAFSGGIGAAIGDFSGIAGSSFKNALCELGHSTLKGFATGLAGGAMISAMKQDASYLIKGAFIGASIGTLTTALKIFTLGTTFDPAEIASITKVERLGQVYRRGSFLFKKGSGITLGNNLSIRLTNNLEYDRHLIQHETAHFLQIQKLGLVNFYLRVLREYFKYGFYDSYKTPGTLEYNAEMYARDGVLLF